MTDKMEIICKLASLPTVSEKAAEGMYLLGIRDKDDLKGKDPNEMYEALRNRKDFFAEPCMLNMLKIAVKTAEKDL